MEFQHDILITTSRPTRILALKRFQFRHFGLLYQRFGADIDQYVHVNVRAIAVVDGFM